MSLQENNLKSFQFTAMKQRKWLSTELHRGLTNYKHMALHANESIRSVSLFGLNSFNQNGISKCYQLDQSISVSVWFKHILLARTLDIIKQRVVGRYFTFLFKFQ